MEDVTNSTLIEDRVAWRKAYSEWSKTVANNPSNLQNVFTPYDLCTDTVRKLEAYCPKMDNISFCIFNLEFAEVLIYDFGVKPSQITFITDCKEKANFASLQRYNGIGVILVDFERFLQEKIDMKFDCVIMNPPYQTKSNNKGKGHTLWDKFVCKAFDVLKDGGALVAIHPSGWRSGGDATEIVRYKLNSSDMLYLEIHGEEDGIKMFKATTRYDWYVAKKQKTKGQKTVILDQDGVKKEVNLDELAVIPNKMIEKFLPLLAKNGSKQCQVLYSRSAYGADKPHVSKDKTTTHKYPVVYSVGIDGPTIFYSNTNKNGHFGVPKLIVNPNRPIGFFIDKDGQYGLTQWCIGIVGDYKYLQMVGKVISNQKNNGFADFIESFHFSNEILDRNVLAMLRKDFWKEFVDAKGKEI